MQMMMGEVMKSITDKTAIKLELEKNKDYIIVVNGTLIEKDSAIDMMDSLNKHGYNIPLIVSVNGKASDSIALVDVTELLKHD